MVVQKTLLWKNNMANKKNSSKNKKKSTTKKKYLNEYKEITKKY